MFKIALATTHIGGPFFMKHRVGPALLELERGMRASGVKIISCRLEFDGRT